MECFYMFLFTVTWQEMCVELLCIRCIRSTSRSQKGNLELYFYVPNDFRSDVYTTIHSISCSWNQAHVQDVRIISGWWIRFQWLLRCRMPKHWRDLMTPQHPRITLAFCVHCFTQFTYDRNYPRTSLPPILVPRHLLIFFGAARAVWCVSLGLSLGSKLRWAGAQTAQTARTAQTACCSTL